MKKRIFKKPLNINKIIALVFFLIIVLGTVLLCLPFASRNGQCAGVRKALFTATSSTCVTGLVLVDTYTQWSGFGQAVILCLIEVGGIGFMSLASFVIFSLKRKANMNTQMLIAQTLGISAVTEAVRVQKKIFGWAFSVQGIGALILTIRFCFDFGFFKAHKLGIFHSVSAYCNAGFDILGFITENGSVSPYKTDPVVCLTLALLIIIGGLGFLVWDEIFRIKNPKKWSVYTKLVVITTVFLLLGGTLLLCITEWDNTAALGEMTAPQKILAFFFQSVTTRTAGFAGINQGALTDAGKLTSTVLMLIGGSSGSTAGGLKTVTFIIIVIFIIRRLRGKKDVSVFCRNISTKQILNALTVCAAMVMLAIVGAFAISVSSDLPIVDCTFETVSALATVGLTTGITPKLNLLSHIILIVYMYFGRVGILTISLGFLRNSESQSNYKYAETNLLIG